MTSVLRRYPHIDARVRYFVPLGTTIETYTFDSNRHTGVADISDVNLGAPLTVVAVSDRLKDLGNTVYVYAGPDNARVQVAIMRLVQRVNGDNTEGGQYSPVWIATWVPSPPSYPGPPIITIAPVTRTG